MKDKTGYFFKNLPKSKYVALGIIIISSIELAIVPTITNAPIVFIVIICQIVGGVIALFAITRGVLDLNKDIKVITKKYQETKKQGNAAKVERNDSNNNELSNEKEIDKVVEINLEEKEVYDVENSNVKESVLEALKQAKENLQNEKEIEKDVQKEETLGKSR